MKSTTQKLTLSGILISLATVLSFLTIYRLPYGGSITPLSMLPIVVLAYMYGIKWGALSGFVYGILQAILGAAISSAFAGQNFWSVLGILFFDYFVAFSILGFAGMFKGKIKNHTVAFATGTLVVTILRYIAHTISGCIFFGSYAQSFFEQESIGTMGSEILETFFGGKLILIYSLVYNGSYMIPEIILTTIAAAIIVTAVKQIRKE